MFPFPITVSDNGETTIDLIGPFRAGDFCAIASHTKDGEQLLGLSLDAAKELYNALSIAIDYRII